ncbi:MAG: hypothetical protein QF812_00325 [Nitrososphaerales archaeon]|jgi:hypothetical protein|nr:hypothetical protein [Nitrososphaerales archaeon]
MVNYIPLITTIVALTFTILLLWQFLNRKKIHQVIWAIAMALFAVAALMEFLANPDISGASGTLIKIYYASAAPLVGLLGSGMLYLLVPRKIAHIYLGIVIMLALALLVGVLSTHLSEVTISEAFQLSLPEGFRGAVRLFPFLTARLPSILLNITGGILLIGGALFSFITDMRKTYNIPLMMGGLFPSLGGFLLGIMDNADIFFEFELAGTIFLFLGFIMSMRYLPRN